MGFYLTVKFWFSGFPGNGLFVVISGYTLLTSFLVVCFLSHYTESLPKLSGYTESLPKLNGSIYRLEHFKLTSYLSFTLSIDHGAQSVSSMSHGISCMPRMQDVT